MTDNGTATARRLEGRLIGLGVCGSIAAYKSVELLRRLTAEGADVVVMLTPSATRFVGPLTFRALSRHPVETDVLDLLPDQRIGHIVIADTADAIVVAPATARWLGAMAAGIADDAVLAACLATSAPVVVAPAMDGDMWTHPATRINVERLRREFGYRVVEPGEGPLASGQNGIGRLADLDDIVDAVVGAVADAPIRQPDAAARPPIVDRLGAFDLEGRRIVVTAGGTAEAIDPVRYIGNRSTGRMGIAIVEAAIARGARVTLIAGRLEVPVPPGVSAVTAESTAAMRDAVVEAVFLGRADALVMAAAVADFRPAHAAPTKLTRDAGLSIELEPTEDILAEVGARGPARSIPAPSSSASPPRPGASTVPPRSSVARAPTSWSPTTSPRPGRGSARRPTGSRSWAATGRATTCRCCPSARSPTGCWTASRACWTSAGRRRANAEPRWTNGGPRRRLDR